MTANRVLVIVYTVLITVLCVLGARGALGAEYSARFGPSIQDGETNGSSKVFGVRREELCLDGIYTGFEAGGYVDNGGHGRRGAALGKAQLGVRPTTQDGLYGSAFVGPALVTTRDSVLGSMPQFATDIGFGIVDQTTLMYIGYSHISNAGIFHGPNKGRDFMVFSAGVRF